MRAITISGAQSSPGSWLTRYSSLDAPKWHADLLFAPKAFEYPYKSRLCEARVDSVGNQRSDASSRTL